MLSDELKQLCDEIITNTEKINELSQEEIIGLRKYINPLGNIVRENKEYAVMSIMNYREDWFKKFYMTSLIGFIFTLAYEYEPTEELENLRKEHDKYKATDEFKALDEIGQKKCDMDYADTRLKYIRSARGLITRFLNNNFEYDPNRHVRSAHKKESQGLTREAIAAACDTRDKASHVLDSIDKKRDAVLDYLRDGLGAGYNTMTSAKNVISSAIDSLATLPPSGEIADAQTLLMKNYAKLSGLADDFAKFTKPLTTAETLSALVVPPPADIFHNFTRYITNNYEALTQATCGVYDATTDIEFAAIFYKSFNNEEDARQYLRSHEAEFRVEPIVVENSGVTLLGPFKENRERIDYYTKNTEILKRMNENKEQEYRLGKDMMEKRAKNAKVRNIEECGPDAPGLGQYAKAVSTVAELGVKRILTREEKDRLEAARAIKEDFEVPEDNIQVDAFYSVGEGEEARLERAKIYTQAEAPLHMTKDSVYAETYQKKRDEGETLSSSSKSKRIVDRNGNVVDVSSLKN